MFGRSPAVLGVLALALAALLGGHTLWIHSHGAGAHVHLFGHSQLGAHHHAEFHGHESAPRDDSQADTRPVSHAAGDLLDAHGSVSTPSTIAEQPASPPAKERPDAVDEPPPEGVQLSAPVLMFAARPASPRLARALFAGLVDAPRLALRARRRDPDPREYARWSSHGPPGTARPSNLAAVLRASHAILI